MIKCQLSHRIADLFVKNEVIACEDKDVYIYGLEQGFLMLTNIVTTILIGLVFRMVWQSIVFMMAYIPLRIYAGGYHTKTQLRCYLFSILLIVLSLLWGGPMETKKEISLETTANKIGCVILIGHLLNLPVLKFFQKILNFKGILSNSIAWSILLLLSSIFLLKVNFKKMFTRTVGENNFGFKSLILLTIFFITFDRFFTFSCVYGTGYYKLVYAMPISGIDKDSSNIMLIAISIFIAAAFEEIIYRGIILENLRKYGDMFAIVVTGLLFGMAHFQLIILKAMTGVILGILYVLGGNLKLPILVHYIFNMGGGLVRYIMDCKFPQVTDIQVDLGILIFSFSIMVISLLLCLKDKAIMSLFQRWSVKNILNQFKQEKSSYKKFFSATAVTFSLAIEFISVISIFTERLNVYFKR